MLTGFSKAKCPCCGHEFIAMAGGFLPIVGAIAAKVAGYILLFKISEWSFHWYYIETDIKFMTISLSVALWVWYFIALGLITVFVTSAYQRICKRIKKENYDN